MTLPAFDSSWTNLYGSPSIYESLRNYLGLMPLRANCWTHCWMSADASTEWKSYSRPRWNYVAWLPGSTPYSVFKSMTLGTRSLFVSAGQQSETSIQVQKSVLRLRTLKSLTLDGWKERLTSTPVSAMRRWTRFGFGSGGSKMSGKTSSQSSRSVSSSTLWSAENADIVQDILDFKLRIREESDYGVWP